MIDEHNVSANTLFVAMFQQYDVKTMVIDITETTIRTGLQQQVEYEITRQKSGINEAYVRTD